MKAICWITSSPVKAKRHPQKFDWEREWDCCRLSPVLFNTYCKWMFAGGLYNATNGIFIDGEIINNMKYADTVILADCAGGIQG